MPSPNEIEIDRLMIQDPAEYERRLNYYFALIGGKRNLLWWQRCAEGELKSWPSCVRAALIEMAQKAKISPPALADWLDYIPMPRTRAHVINLARKHLAATYK